VGPQRERAGIDLGIGGLGHGILCPVGARWGWVVILRGAKALRTHCTAPRTISVWSWSSWPRVLGLWTNDNGSQAVRLLSSVAVAAFREPENLP
jgi:hypothetical protein